MSINQAQAVIGPSEFNHWMAYYLIEPFGENRADWRTAQICCLLHSAFKKKSTRYAKLEDFMYDYRINRKIQTPESMWKLAKIITMAAGKKGKIINPKGK